MNSEVKITHRQWSGTLEEVHYLKKVTDANNRQIANHADRITKLEHDNIELPRKIEKGIEGALAPVMQSIADLTQENIELNKKIIEASNEKYKILVSIFTKIFITIFASLAISFIGYIAALLINNYIQK